MKFTEDFSLEEEILDALQEQNGRVGFYYKNLVTEEEFSWRSEEAFLAASVIKLPIYCYISALAANGELSMEEEIQVREEDKVPLCGALSLFSGELTCDIKTLCRLMISLSDNTAANLLIERLGIGKYNEGFREMGLKGTVLKRFLFDEESAVQGRENKIVPREMAMLLEQVYRRRFVSAAVSEEIEDTLCLQQIQHKIKGRLPQTVRVANKTGEDEGITHDVGLIYGKQPFILCFTAEDTSVPQFEDFIRHTSARLFQYSSRT